MNVRYGKKLDLKNDAISYFDTSLTKRGRA